MPKSKGRKKKKVDKRRHKKVSPAKARLEDIILGYLNADLQFEKPEQQEMWDKAVEEYKKRNK